MRAAYFLPAFVPLLPLSAFAGDYADREILGFSPDGAYFAFEEYGVLDGSAMPYANIYVLDVDRDAWVDGTPFRLRREVEGAPLDPVRAEVRKRAEPILKNHAIAPAGRLVASNPATEASADPYAVRFFVDNYGYLPERPWSLTLTAIPFPDPTGCENLGPVQGFRLVLTDPQGATQTLNEDTKVPASRGCAQDYAITDVQTYFPERNEAVIVVLLAVITQGFEGPDRRFIAVASRFGAN